MNELLRVAPLSFALALTTAACARPQAPTPPPVEAGEIVLGHSLVLHSEILGEDRLINVYLPASYAGGEASYPVLYLLDGGTHQDFVPMAGMAALAGLSGQYREFILVGVQSNDRGHELTSPSEVAFDRERLPQNGGAADFRRFLVEEVQPTIDASYRTTRERALIGESLAGLFVAETFLRAPQSFTHYLAISPSLWWQDMALGREAAALLEAGDFRGRSLYLTTADEGWKHQEGADLLVAALEEHAPRCLRWWYDPLRLEHHNTIYNPAALRALRLVFAP